MAGRCAEAVSAEKEIIHIVMTRCQKTVLNVLFLFVFLCAFSGVVSGENINKTPAASSGSSIEKRQNGMKALRSILELEDSIKKRIKIREKQLALEKSANEKQRI